jgi:hypothetical protein
MSASAEKYATLSPELEISRQAYEKQVTDLATKFPLGYYAVFIGAAFIGAFKKYGEALKTGYKEAGNSPFFVKQIHCSEEVQCVVSPILLDA